MDLEMVEFERYGDTSVWITPRHVTSVEVRQDGDHSLIHLVDGSCHTVKGDAVARLREIVGEEA